MATKAETLKTAPWLRREPTTRRAGVSLFRRAGAGLRAWVSAGYVGPAPDVSLSRYTGARV